MSEPTTEAGRALWHDVRYDPASNIVPSSLATCIAAIETEAKAAERDRIAGLVRGLRRLPPEGSRPLYVRWSTREDTITAVLALLEKQP